MSEPQPQQPTSNPHALYNPPQFTTHPSLNPYLHPVQPFLQNLHTSTLNLSGPPIIAISTATAIFNPSPSTITSQPRLLLIQRAPHDSMPNHWEFPGGAVDDTDSTILHGAAREIYEEAGLVATRFETVLRVDEPEADASVEAGNLGGAVSGDGLVGKGILPDGTLGGGDPGRVFSTRSGKRVVQYFFVGEVDGGKEGGVEVRLDPNEHQDYAWVREEEVREGRLADGREFEITTDGVRGMIFEAFRWKRAG